MDILRAEELDISFYSEKAGREIHAVDHVSFSLSEGEFLGLVGESGCGKSTAARIISGLVRPDSGTVYLKEKALQYPFPRSAYRVLQMVFQMPKESFDPRRRIGPCITAMEQNFGTSRAEAEKQTRELLERVGLNASYYSKFPHQMSGGECQRAAIARALSVRPEVLLCDEVTSSLDVSVQAQVVELLQEIHKTAGISVLFISHDLALVQGICSRIMVMHDGRIVEEGPSSEVLKNPSDEYTKHLLASALMV